MNITNIRQRRKEVDVMLAEARAQKRRAQVELELLQEICEHPNEFRTSHMGESCLHCPDCGYCP